MNQKLKYFFVFIFTFSVFSLTLQSAVINACKGSKVFKTQSQTPVSEEEEEKTHSEKSSDEETLYVHNHVYSKFLQNQSQLTHRDLQLYLPSVTKKIQIPPPKQ